MSKTPRLNLPMQRPQDVIAHLGQPGHWKQGRSAKSVADAWFSANGLPPKVKAVLSQADSLRDAELVDAILERCTDLCDGQGQASQTDLLGVLKANGRLQVLGVEAKVTEPFGELVSDWLAKGGESRRIRLAKLCLRLGLDPEAIGGLRYQLFHRTVATLIEAERFCAESATLLVHSFCPKASGLADFIAFGQALGFERLGKDSLSEPRSINGRALRLAWVADQSPVGLSSEMRSVDWLNDFGRTRLSPNFFMRDFLFSDIAAVHGLSNIPDNPERAIAAGSMLCQELLEPLQAQFGRVVIRSAYRSAEVNGLGNRMQRRKVKGYNCASNEANAAAHIWDHLDKDGCMGATACITLPLVWDRFGQESGGWQRLAWWIHDHLPYSSLYFFPTFWAFNISWHERPERRIDSYVEPAGCLTKPGYDNHGGSHQNLWQDLVTG